MRLRIGSRISLIAFFMMISSSQAADTFFTAPNGRPVNLVKDGSIIPAGTYYNSENGTTTFTNKASGSLWLKSGSMIRGMEVDQTGHATGNGGSFHLYAPNSVVRVDGDINVSNIQRQDPFFGNGGKVTVDAAFYYQNGNIFANGYQGGAIQFNVGAASFGNTAKIEAQGYSAPGSINIKADGIVDIARRAVMSIQSETGFPTGSNSLISIEGSLVNMEGVIKADAQNIDGSNVQLTSHGNTNLLGLSSILNQAEQSKVLTADEAHALYLRQTNLKNLYDGDIRIASASGSLPAAQISANGGTNIAEDSYTVGHGGTITLTAKRDILNGGSISANGSYGFIFKGFQSIAAGSGGSVIMQAGRNIHNSNRIVTDGGMAGPDNFEEGPTEAGLGGLQSYRYGGGLFNSGVLRAHGGIRPTSSQGIGGQGGTIIFNGLTPRGNGIVSTLGGPAFTPGALGTIQAKNPVGSSNILIGKWENIAE